MKSRLIWKLFGLNLLVIGFVVLIVWGAVDYLAKDYFTILMEKYHISPDESHQMFVDSIHLYLIWGSAGAALFSGIIGYLITRRILGPLTQMTRRTRTIASGDFSAGIPVTTRDEVGELARAFNRMTESLHHMEQLRKNMIVDVAHEFKTPLTNIQGYLEALTDKVVPPSPEIFQLLEDETRRLVYLVSDILKLTRAGGAKINLDILHFPMIDALNHVYKMFSLKFDQKSIQIDHSGVNPQYRVYADPHKLAQILHNLFQNALQYTPEYGYLRIFTEDSGDGIRLVFANTGSELNEKDLPLIFERFYRAEKSRSREFGGAGIGLSVVKDLVEAHKGRVGASIQDDEFQVWFTLPTELNPE